MCRKDIDILLLINSILVQMKLKIKWKSYNSLLPTLNLYNLLLLKYKLKMYKSNLNPKILAL